MGKKIIIEAMYLYKYDKPENGITVGGSQKVYLLIWVGYFIKWVMKLFILPKLKEIWRIPLKIGQLLLRLTLLSEKKESEFF